MSKQANTYLIGIFVLAACALFVAGLVLFGSGSFFREQAQAILFFDGSVKGLKVGGSVTFRGVKIGEVSDMQVQLNPSTGVTRIPVVIDIYGDKITSIGDKPEVEGAALGVLIKKGLRARLEMESIVTGILAINLDFYPEKEANYVGGYPQYREIPTVPSTLEELSNTLEQLPLQSIAEGIDTVVTRLGELLKSEDAESIATSLTETMEELRKTLKSFSTLSQNLDSKVDPISDEFLATLRSARMSLKNVDDTVVSAGTFLKKSSDGSSEIEGLIENLKDAAVKVRDLAEYLERHPESLLQGKRE